MTTARGMEVDWREDFLEGEKKDGRCMSGAEAWIVWKMSPTNKEGGEVADTSWSVL